MGENLWILFANFLPLKKIITNLNQKSNIRILKIFIAKIFSHNIQFYN